MSLFKKAKDSLLKALYRKGSVPRGLVELNEYFRFYDPIAFCVEKENGTYIAISKNFRYGSIVTSASTLEELDEKIEDAILTSFSVPSSYAKEANVKREGQNKMEYAFA